MLSTMELCYPKQHIIPPSLFSIHYIAKALLNDTRKDLVTSL